MDNLNFITLGGTLGLITLTLQLINYRPLRNSFLVLLLIWLVTLTPYFPWPTEDYVWVFIFIIFILIIIMLTATILEGMTMKGKDKAVAFVYLSIILLALMIPMLIATGADVLLWLIFVLLSIAIVVMTVWSGIFQRAIKRKFNFKRDIRLIKEYLKNNYDLLWIILINILAIFFILLVAIMTIQADSQLPKSPITTITLFGTVNTVALILGVTFIFHSSLLSDDLDWYHGEKTSKTPILLIQLLLSLEMIIGVGCILISINNFALLFQQ